MFCIQAKAQEYLTHCQKLIEQGGLNETDTFNVYLLREELKLFVDGARHQG